MKKKKRIAALLLAALLLTGCAAKTSPDSQPSSTATSVPDTTKSTGVGFYFDTVVTVTLYGAPEGLMDEIWAACAQYENLLSKTIATSDVSRINTADGQTVTVDAETWEILRRAKEISSLTGGAFSVTIAPLTAMWDFTDGTNRMPTDEERIAALPLVGDSRIELGENNTVTLPAGMQIDLGGIAKGYIADKVAELVRGRCYGAIISLGGNVYTVGDKPDGSLVSVGIQDPEGPTNTYFTVVYTKDKSVVTSGTYERGFTLDGVRYHHILDPKSGLPSASDLVSATLVMESSMDADALATACIVVGSEEALKLLAAQKVDGLLVTTDGQVLYTEGFPEAYMVSQ
ncbi:MAG: FAD:protein FMN transferase [Clostridia bacterium]|nr:FAD:protein FMN transferase [Clostridia bacterium]